MAVPAKRELARREIALAVRVVVIDRIRMKQAGLPQLACVGQGCLELFRFSVANQFATRVDLPVVWRAEHHRLQARRHAQADTGVGGYGPAVCVGIGDLLEDASEVIRILGKVAADLIQPQLVRPDLAIDSAVWQRYTIDRG